MRSHSVAVVAILGVVALQCNIAIAQGPGFAPYVDLTLRVPDLPIASEMANHRDFNLAFVHGGLDGSCYPSWGNIYAIDDPYILNKFKPIQARGGRMILVTGGAVGPYLEHKCASSEDLARAYKVALDTTGTYILDIDVETYIDQDLVNGALAILQRDRPHVLVGYTMMVQGEDYGLTHQLGVKILENAKLHGVNIHFVNGMTMEYPSSQPNWCDAVIRAGEAIIRQLAGVWPEKSPAEIRKMLGVTPMIGRNFNGKKFLPEHGRQLVKWANDNEIGFLSFWSIARDNGNCNDVVSPICSGVSQSEYEFTKIFSGFGR